MRIVADTLENTQTNAKPLILYGAHGGMGHKYKSFLCGIAYAISGKRPVKSNGVDSTGT